MVISSSPVNNITLFSDLVGEGYSILNNIYYKYKYVEK